MTAANRLVKTVTFILMLTMASAVSATGEERDMARVQAVISGQIEAFLSDDVAGAYEFAAPSIRKVYPTPEAFVSMVRRGYSPVYKPRSYAFGKYALSGGVHVQAVDVIGPDGRAYQALYTLEKTDAGLVITGCYIKPALGV